MKSKTFFLADTVTKEQSEETTGPELRRKLVSGRGALSFVLYKSRPYANLGMTVREQLTCRSSKTCISPEKSRM